MIFDYSFERGTRGCPLQGRLLPKQQVMTTTEAIIKIGIANMNNAG